MNSAATQESQWEKINLTFAETDEWRRWLVAAGRWSAASPSLRSKGGRHMLPMSPPPAFSYAPPDSSNLSNLHITTRVVQPQHAFFAACVALVSTFDLILCEDSYHSRTVTRRSRLLFTEKKITVPPFHADSEGNLPSSSQHKRLSSKYTSSWQIKAPSWEQWT